MEQSCLSQLMIDRGHEFRTKSRPSCFNHSFNGLASAPLPKRTLVGWTSDAGCKMSTGRRASVYKLSPLLKESQNSNLKPPKQLSKKERAELFRLIHSEHRSVKKYKVNVMKAKLECQLKKNQKAYDTFLEQPNAEAQRKYYDERVDFVQVLYAMDTSL